MDELAPNFMPAALILAALLFLGSGDISVMEPPVESQRRESQVKMFQDPTIELILPVLDGWEVRRHPPAGEVGQILLLRDERRNSVGGETQRSDWETISISYSLSTVSEEQSLLELVQKELCLERVFGPEMPADMHIDVVGVDEIQVNSETSQSAYFWNRDVVWKVQADFGASSSSEAQKAYSLILQGLDMTQAPASLGELLRKPNYLPKPLVIKDEWLPHCVELF